MLKGQRMNRERWATRFWAKVDRSGGPDACWPWTGSRSKKGYGLIWRRRAHRVAYELTYGEIPAPTVRHSCDNPPCCNPAHLLAGTVAENNADCLDRGRHVSVGGDAHWTRQRPERLARGPVNGAAKIDVPRVQVIRSCVAEGESKTAIAQALGVSRSLVSLIARRKIWAHVPEEGAE